MAALGRKAAVASSNVSARASSAGALGMLYTRHMDTSAAISAAKYLLLRPPHYSRTVALALACPTERERPFFGTVGPESYFMMSGACLVPLRRVCGREIKITISEPNNGNN